MAGRLSEEYCFKVLRGTRDRFPGKQHNISVLIATNIITKLITMATHTNSGNALTPDVYLKDLIWDN